MKDIVKCIENLRLQLERHRKAGLKELPTRTIFIDPMLKALGWDVCDPDEVGLEHTTIDAKSVDYALKVLRKVVLHLEAKPLNDPLEDVKAITQVVGYAANDGVEWCVLTNGIRYKIYKVSEKVSAPDKLLFEVSIDPKDSDGVPVEELAKTLSRISRDSMEKGLLEQLGTEIFTTGKVRKALDHLFTETPPPFTRLVRKTLNDPTVTPTQVQQAMKRLWLGTAAPDPATTPAGAIRTLRPTKNRKPRETTEYPESYHTDGKPKEIVEIYRALDRLCQNMAPGQVTKKHCKMYVGWYRDNTVFCSAHLYQARICIWVKGDPKTLDPSITFTRDVTKIGHWGNGNVELSINDLSRLHDAEPFIRKSFENSNQK
jgi:predicted transport protein